MNKINWKQYKLIEPKWKIKNTKKFINVFVKEVFSYLEKAQKKEIKLREKCGCLSYFHNEKCKNKE